MVQRSTQGAVDGEDNYVLKYNTRRKMMTLNERWPKNLHEQCLEIVIQVQVRRHLYLHAVARKSR